MKTIRPTLISLIAALVLLLAACGTQPTAPIAEDEEVTQPTTGTATLVLPGQSKATTVTYSIENGEAIFEGDIILGEVDAQGNLIQSETLESQAVAIDGNKYRWPNGVIPYVVDSTLDATMQSKIWEAFRHWEANSNINLEPKESTDKDYVVFTAGSGCASAVGHKGGRQSISLGSECSVGNIIHEIGHAVGLWHEQSREDRDKFIKINTANILSGYSNNFDKHISDGFDIGSYDYGSIMHYVKTAFAKDRDGCAVDMDKCTIVAINSDGTVNTSNTNLIGQRNGLSSGDIAAAKKLYPNRIDSYGLNKDEFFAHNTAMARNSYVPVKISGYEVEGSARFAVVWERIQGAKRETFVDIPVSDFGTHFNSKVSEGYHLRWVNGYTVKGSNYFTFVWEKAASGQFATYFGLTSSEYQTLATNLTAQGYRPKMVDGYDVNGGMRFVTLWEKTTGPSWITHHDMDSSTFSSLSDSYYRQGYKIVQLSGYNVNGVAKYAAIWEKRADYANATSRIDMDTAAYHQRRISYESVNYGLEDVSVFNINGVPYYAGIWAKR